MSDIQQELTKTKLKEEQMEKQESIQTTSQQIFKEESAGTHDEMISQLDKQMTILGEIRKSGVPDHLEPAQQESTRYQKLGHTEMKARKSAAKEAQTLTKKAKDLNAKLKEIPAGSVTVSLDLKMAEYMKQAELETLKANGYKSDSPEYQRAHMKYLRHSQVILEKALGEQDMSPEQTKQAGKALAQIENKISAVQNVEDLQEQQYGYDREVEREAGKEKLSAKEGARVMKRALRVAKEIPLDMLSTRVFSPKLARVDDKQAEEILKQDQKAVETEQAQVKRFVEMRELKPGEPKIMITDVSDLNFQDNEETEFIDKLVEELDKHKSKLGGSPNFYGETPTLEKEGVKDDGKVILGMDRVTFKNWVAKYTYKDPKVKRKVTEVKAVEKKQYNPLIRGFVKMIGKIHGVDPKANNPTPYEEARLELLHLRKLAQVKDQIVDLFKEAGNETKNSTLNETCSNLLSHACGFMCHCEISSPQGDAFLINNFFEIMHSFYEKATSKEKVDDFFRSLHGVCFEDRSRILLEGFNAIQEKTKRKGVPEEGLQIRYEEDMPITTEDLMLTDAAVMWINNLDQSSCSKYGISFEEALPCLRHELVGKKFFPISEKNGFGKCSDEPVVITDEMVNCEEFKRALVNANAIWEEDVLRDMFGQDTVDVWKDCCDHPEMYGDF